MNHVESSVLLNRTLFQEQLQREVRENKRRISEIERKERHRYYQEKRKRTEREWKEQIEKEARED